MLLNEVFCYVSIGEDWFRGGSGRSYGRRHCGIDDVAFYRVMDLGRFWARAEVLNQSTVN